MIYYSGPHITLIYYSLLRSPHYMALMSDLGTRAYADVEWNECQSPCVVFYKMGLLVQ